MLVNSVEQAVAAFPETTYAGATHRGAQWYRQHAKRALDLIAVLLLLPLALPLIGFAAALIWLGDGTPFYGHMRVGLGGRQFRCWKLRSMRRDGDAVLAAHLAANPAAAEEWLSTRKLARDPRVTRLGRFLRRSSIDELPQLLNVFRGEMSLVGPRPVTRPELALYGTVAAAYMSLVPGITGMWQVRGRNSLSFGERIGMDAEYARRISLGTDIAILLLTARAVISSGS